jgi:patatin-like phospholipase/acyl hydrolase
MFQPMFDSIYDARYLENVLSEIFQDKRLGDITKPLLIPSTDIGNGCVHVLKSGYSKDFTRDNTVMVKDAVLAACSAPTYFDPHRLKEYLLADGGLWANNPALAAVIDHKNVCVSIMAIFEFCRWALATQEQVMALTPHGNGGLPTGETQRTYQLYSVFAEPECYELPESYASTGRSNGSISIQIYLTDG